MGVEHLHRGKRRLSESDRSSPKAEERKRPHYEGRTDRKTGGLSTKKVLETFEMSIVKSNLIYDRNTNNLRACMVVKNNIEILVSSSLCSSITSVVSTDLCTPVTRG